MHKISCLLLISTLLFGASCLVIGIFNTIHSLLLLIFVLFLGSLLLFRLKLNSHALLFFKTFLVLFFLYFLYGFDIIDVIYCVGGDDKAHAETPLSIETRTSEYTIIKSLTTRTILGRMWKYF